jgi:hypothetical protein
MPSRVEWSIAEISKRSTRVSECGCWIWRGHKKGGYGYVNIRNNGRCKPHRAHRISWSVVNGPIPDGLDILHKCDTPSCVNPDHLYAGTDLENMRDKHERGRARYVRGLEHPNSKLTPEMVRIIRNSSLLPREIAASLGVSKHTVYDVLWGRSWSHVS